MCSPELSDFESSIWQIFPEEFVTVLGISNVPEEMIADFAETNDISYPLLQDIDDGSGVLGNGLTYDAYFIPGAGSPFPRDFIIDQSGIVRYARNEIDTEAMLLLIHELMENTGLLGDVTNDGTIDVLDIVTEINIILNIIEPTQLQLWAGDLNVDEVIDILDIILLINIILE